MKNRPRVILAALVSLSLTSTSQCMWLSIPGIPEMDSDPVDFGESLFRAALADDINHVRWRLQCGADPNMRVTTIRSCPETIAIGRNVLTPQDLLGSTALHLAIEHAKVTRLLLEHGADPNIKNERGCTPLHDASFGHHFYTMESLVQHGADVETRDHRNETPLHKAAAQYIISNVANSYPCRLQAIALRTLLEAGAEMTEGDGVWPAVIREETCRQKRGEQFNDRAAKRARSNR